MAEPKNEHPLDACVRNLREWAYCDSLVQLDRKRVRDALSDDHAACGRLMTDDECMRFVCGGDDGAPPPELARDFPRTHALLEEYWQ